MTRILGLLLLMVLLFSATPIFGQSAPDFSRLGVEVVADGFVRPLYVTHAGDGSQRLFVVEQGGRIWIIQDDERLPEPFADVSAWVSADANGFGYSERGLLGLAFDPNFVENQRVYLNYTDRDGNTVIARLRVSADDPNRLDLENPEILLQIPQPYPNHNGGHLVFGPDGYLYVGMGDGGSQGDPQGNAQNPNSFLGKLLRLDVSGERGYVVPADNPWVESGAGLPEVWAYGLRNPWRFSFDRLTGDLYIGDVGGSAWEEVNFQPAESGGGQNYGWNLFEADQARTAAGSDGLTMPILSYSHAEGVSITGGYVYRGSALPELNGVYFYADFGFGTVWAGWQDAQGSWQSAVVFRNTGYTVSSFGQDEAGELYIINYAGSLIRLIAT